MSVALSRRLIHVVALLVFLVPGSFALAEVVNVYSARHYDVDQMLYDAFTEETGIEVQVLEGSSDQLVERIRREGMASPADVLVTVDAGRLWRAEDAGILQPVDSEFLNDRIPAYLRHPEGLWFGLSQRVRVIYYSPERFDPSLVSSYEDLTRPELEGRICIRSSNNIYNQSLMASIIEAHGAEAAEEWARGVVANMARSPEGGDTDQIRAVAAGECDVAVGNQYYYLRLVNSEDPADRAVAQQVSLIIPNQEGRGVHVNVGGAGVVAGAPNRENAVRFLEFLASDQAQELFANETYEFPVVDGVEKHPTLEALGEMKFDELGMDVLGRTNPEAVRVFDRAGWR
ncbi:extracellular solute-binding protein [Wenzhouxiangella limi]|uniref:Extracellular solute-binding protein n=1 Tax=Wenzhouxiangella limi TaxID=2707351 RepID=A0A845UZ61_9GAMM|nr:extracellular solute-binding protein [Wenzhouxiangella limi]NDY95190.1 extracellular solute-binding protein [Wenzhouxiangella limi]